ncbi:hypothetical protein F4808DRAFT_418442 [Astrocystis sublimbata]|nr:hypothetical protein F4808DRAFT_418442 [Astrocystis sublimbata]
MFTGSRRRRPPPPQPLNSATANPNAATAASAAFMSAANPNPNKALSSAAAAAALRARPHTPTNVAEVQTKRTARRSASISSSGSARNGSQPPNDRAPLQRRGSTSSMTDRTFRSPSPHGRSSKPVAAEEQPPVPKIPDSHKRSTTSSRTAGVGMQNFRTASQKMASEPPSYYVQPTGDVSNVRRSDSVIKAAEAQSPPRPQQSGRSDSRNSINYSYPIGFRPQSPPLSPVPRSAPRVKSPRPTTSSPDGSQQLVYDPNSRRMVPKPHTDEPVAEYEVKQPTTKSSKRRKDGSVRREGSQLAKGTVARATGTMVTESKKSRQPLSREEPVASEPQPEERTAATDFEPTALSANDDIIDSSRPPQSLESREPRESNTRDIPSSAPESSNATEMNGRSGTPIHEPVVSTPQYEPTVKKEEPQARNHPKDSQPVLDALDTIPTRQAVFDSSGLSKPSQKSEVHDFASNADPHVVTATEEPKIAEEKDEQKLLIAENKPVAVLAAETGDLRRSISISPARQARFASDPAENLAIRHAPPPRSASPIKSALKNNSPLPRETSPPDNVSDLSGSGAVSPMPRKKSVRVSFDDNGPVVFEDSSSAAGMDSPSSQSPQSSKRAWFSTIGRNKKKDLALDDDEVMKPRPALPSFGSIREKKKRELEERPLVRPVEPEQPVATSSSPELRPQSSSTLNDSETTEEPLLGQSNDVAIGALLAQDHSSRIAANTSRFREPLPPVVTSIEGSGYSSDSLHSSDGEESTGNEMGIGGMDSSVMSTQLTQPDTDDVAQHSETDKFAPATAEQQTIPQISIVEPSPMRPEPELSADRSAGAQYFDVPGGFPDTESDLGDESQLKNTNQSVESASSAAIFEPNVGTIEPGQEDTLPQTTLDTVTNLKAPEVATDESDESSIYSDAYEDIPDLDDGGFMSLDAIVESPIREKLKTKLLKASESSPMSGTQMEHAGASESHPSSQTQDSLPQDLNDWEHAKTFWRSLTAEKRRQLEREATEDAGADGDREEVSLPVRRNSSRRKPTEQRQSIKRASAAESKPAPVAQDRPAQTKSRMRTSLRDQQPTRPMGNQPQTGMRKSMRSNGGPQSVSKPSTNRQATANNTPATTLTKSNQPRAAQPGPQSSTVLASKAASHAKPSLQRRGSDGSDSSFKRSRPAPNGASAFRSTMRQTSTQQPPQEPTRGSGRFSLRSLSPVGSTVRRGSDTSFGASPSGQFRRTLRSNSESSHEAKRSSIHFPLFARSSAKPPPLPKSKPKARAGGGARGSKWSSRFDDSSDEEAGTSAGFMSRLRDSSDEEEEQHVRPGPSSPKGVKDIRSQARAAARASVVPEPLSPRPAPVPEVEEDSPDLPDSDDDVVNDDPLPSPMQSPGRARTTFDNSQAVRPKFGAIGTSTLGRGGITPSFTAPELTTSSSPTTPDKRGSLFDILRRNKRAGQTLGSPGKIQRSSILVDSAARRDTRLERDGEELKGLRSIGGGEAPTPTSPKLQKMQKRHSMVRSGSDSMATAGALRRPNSAGNLLTSSASNSNHAIGTKAMAGGIERPNMDGRRSVSLGQMVLGGDEGGVGGHVPVAGFEYTAASSVAGGAAAGDKNAKKKKFGALRRMFKLDE